MGDNLGGDDDPKASQPQAVLDRAPDAFVSMARGGRIVELNRRVERMFGWLRRRTVALCLATLDGCRWSHVKPALCALLGYGADQPVGRGFPDVV